MWVGDPGSKKTYSLMDALVCVALGKPWLGFGTLQGSVLIVDEESGLRRLQRRLGAVLLAHDAPPGTPVAYTSLEMFNLREPKQIARLDALLTAVQPVLVAIDALADVMPGADENSVKDTQPVFMALRGLAERHQCAIVVIHHSNKAGSYRGSTAICGAVDMMLMVESKPESPDVDFATAKVRDTEPLKFAAAAHFQTDAQGVVARVYLTPTGPVAARPRDRSKGERYVLRYLREQGPATIKAIREHADSCSPTTARQAVYSLADQGLVARTDACGPGEQATYALTVKAEALDV
jgi:hypothetical protein